MFVDLPKNLIILTLGAFVLGWILSVLSSRLGEKFRARNRDPRDGQIRSLEAELRITRADGAEAKEQVEQLEKDLAEATAGIEKRDSVISHLQKKLKSLKIDLRESIKKTRELRAELSERATENIRSEVKLREVTTELEVAHASTDMIATGVLDYSLVQEALDAEEGDDPIKSEVGATTG